MRKTEARRLVEMSKFLRFIGYAAIVCSIILGIVYGIRKDPILEALNMDDEGFRWIVAVYWWVSGIITGALFIAFSTALDYLEENNSFLRELLSRTDAQTNESGTNKTNAYAIYTAEVSRKYGDSKPATSKLEGYQFKAND